MKNLPFDAIALNCVTNELNNKLSGGRIEKIHQPERDEIWLTVKNGREMLRLLISADSSYPRIHLTKNTKPNPLSAPMFCMLLRKKLEGGKITAVKQRGFERIAEIEIEGYSELGDIRRCVLIAEIMGRHSNIILTENGKIVDSVKRVDMTVSSVRCILPGLTYQAPPAQDKILPSSADRDTVYKVLSGAGEEKTAEKVIVSSFMGFSPLAGREIAYRATGSEDARINRADAGKIADELCAFLDMIRGGQYTPTVIYDKDTGKAVDFAAYGVTMYRGIKEAVSFDSLSEAMDEFYYSRDLWERARRKSAAVRKAASNALERCKKKMIVLQDTLGEAENMETYRLYGELLTANLYRFKDGAEAVQAENFYEEGAPPVTIPLDKTRSVSKNAENYFKKYRKAKHAKETATVQLEKNAAETEYLTSVLGSLDIAETEADINEIKAELISQGYIRTGGKTGAKKQKQKDKPLPPLRFECGGYEILVGRNNRQNDQLTLKTAENYDIWLHVKNAPGSHVIIRRAEGSAPDSVIEAAASLAAYYSSLRQSNMAEVDYTTVRNVKKPNGALPGKVIYVNYKTAYVEPKKIGTEVQK